MNKKKLILIIISVILIIIAIFLARPQLKAKPNIEIENTENLIENEMNQSDDKKIKESIASNEQIRKEELRKKYESKLDRKKVENITEKIKINSNNSELYFERAELYLVLYEIKKAYDDYTTAINLDKKKAKYYIRRAWTYNTTEISKAEDDILKSEELSNSDKNNLLIIQYYIYIEKYDMALEKIKRIKRRNKDYYYELLYICDETDNIEKLIESSDEYIKKYPQNEDGYMYKAKAYNKNGEYEKALEVYDNGIKKIKNSIKMLNGKGNIYCLLERYNDAIQVLDKSIELSSEGYESAFAYMLRGKAYEGLGKYEKAEKDYQRAIEIDISDNENLDNRKLSLDCYEKLIELNEKYMQKEKVTDYRNNKNEIEEYREILNEMGDRLN